MAIFDRFSRKNLPDRYLPNLWDILAFALLISLIFFMGAGSKQLTMPYHPGMQVQVLLDMKNLPAYGLYSVMRMIIALILSWIFSLIFATWAAKSKTAERFIIPAIDVLQSVPILGFLPIGFYGFMMLFPHSMLSLQCAAIFALFTSQVWNITLSLYQGLRSVPKDLIEAADMYQLTGWQKYWQIEIPHALPNVVWNSMLSLSAGWFFVVASESITIAHHNIMLPGIGSYIALAVQAGNLSAITQAILMMLFIILIYDQLMLRPLVFWTNKFKGTPQEDDITEKTWVMELCARTRIFKYIGYGITHVWQHIITRPWCTKKPAALKHKSRTFPIDTIMTSAITLIILLALFYTINTWFIPTISLHTLLHVLWLGLLTAIRITLLTLLCLLIWVPIGTAIGSSPKWAYRLQSLIQFVSAIPVNLFYPLCFMLIIQYHLNVNIWTSPLIVLGTQWYILFNVISGTLALPQDTKQAVQLYQVKGIAYWRTFLLPSIFPELLTGTITAVGGAWNASIVAEVVSWKGMELKAAGLGAYIVSSSNSGSFTHLALGVIVMCFYVLVINHFIWQPLYQLAQSRYHRA
jgi:NitT/TauT family transport system permease protein